MRKLRGTVGAVAFLALYALMFLPYMLFLAGALTLPNGIWLMALAVVLTWAIPKALRIPL